METTKIAVYNMSTFESKWATVNRKALKFGLLPITYRVVGDITERDKRWNDLVVIGKEVEIAYQGDVQLPGKWKLIAALDHTEKLINVVPGENLPEEYRDRGNVCDHCHVNRYRLETFVIYNSDTDEYFQIGRNCLGDFLGIDPARLLGQIDLRKEMNFEDEDWSGPRLPSGIGLVSYLTTVSAVMREFGWMSRSMAKDMVTDTRPTADMAWEAHFDQLTDNWGNKVKIEWIDQDKEIAKKTFEWMQSLSSRNNLSDYLLNLARIGENEFVTEKSIGFAASAINAYVKEESSKRIGSGEHLGKVGDKITATVHYEKSYGFDSSYGYQFRHIFHDRKGNTITWKTNKSINDLGINITREYVMQATVKEHTVFNSIAQTAVTRAKLV